MTDLPRQEVDAKLAANKAEVDARLAQFDTSIQTGFAGIRADFAEMRMDIANLRADTSRQLSEFSFKIIGAVAGIVSIGVAAIGIMINMNKSDKLAAAPPAPVILPIPTVPPAPSSPQGTAREPQAGATQNR